ncbi:hypothetical protein ACT4S2_14760 [Kocuria turfanensis]|uniref:STAS domain-containing protein n=1 Tax=Kocuria turfanensis TaxID=388357 RepID=A0A512I8Z3_9MICC|nr:hypothetical protein [Kocuria turfanensis]GEO94127.1 hypothetical protein KTU01_02500 [Kocuria turfanensis]
MQRKISVLVEVDLDGRYVRVDVTGAVTAVNQQGLHPVLRRARTMLPAATVRLDLSCVRDLDPHALDLLREAVEQDPGLGDAVEILAPERIPSGAAATALDARRRLRHGILQRRAGELPVPLPQPALSAAS